jgi:hypothetical protein
MKLVLASELQFPKRAIDLLEIPHETRPAAITWAQRYRQAA